MVRISKKVIDADPSKWKIQINWPTAVLIVGLLVSTITFFLMWKNSNSTINDLKAEVATLTNTSNQQASSIAALKSTQDVVNNAFSQFVNYSPTLFDARISRCETALGLSHTIAATQPFQNLTPPK